MSGAKHTPGPWNLHPFSTNGTQRVPPDDGGWAFAYQMIGQGETLIARAEWDDSQNGGYPAVASYEEMMANANLIAVAPEMYARLENLKGLFEEEGYYDDAESLGKLLKKARGEA